MTLRLLLLLGCCLVSLGAAQWTPLRPHSIPIVARSPFMSIWLRGTDETEAGDATRGWTKYWLGMDHQWTGILRVDGVVFSWFGPLASDSVQRATQQAVDITPTRTIFSFTAGPVNLTATFTSPVETDHVKASMPFAYLEVAVASNDDQPHETSLYMDIDAAWLVGASRQQNRTASTTTTASRSDGVIIHSAQLVDQELFAQGDLMILQGSLLHAALPSPGSTFGWQSGMDNDLRGAFIGNRPLTNISDANVRQLGDSPLVLAYEQILSITPSTSSSALFAVGHARDPTIQYLGADRSAYFFSAYANIEDAIAAFLLDYTGAKARAEALDERIMSAARATGGENYAAICALSLRQAMAGLELTVGGSPGAWNESDAMVFLQEVGSQFVQTVDVLYPMLPLFLLIDPTLLTMALEPLLRFQASGAYPHQYSQHDLGNAYPLAPGVPSGNDEPMPVEESANMIIMALAAAQATGNTDQLTRYFPLLSQFANYLIENGLAPVEQLTTDDFAGTAANQTNLALKAVVGIRAMASVAELLGQPSETLLTTATDFTTRFLQLATSSTGDHLTFQYGNDSSWSTAYNLYADRLLGLNIFPEAVYELQDAWYRTVAQPYGVPLDSRATYQKTDWAIWAAAVATTNTTRDLFIDGVHDYIANTADTLSNPLADLYDTVTGREASFLNRPTVGAHFALLTLPPRNTTASTSPSTLPSVSSPIRNAAFSLSPPLLLVLSLLLLFT